jgi:hypothetical protein
MSASKRVCSVKEKRNFLTEDNSRAGSVFRAMRNCGWTWANELRTAARSTAGNPMFGRCAFQFQIGKFFCSVFIVRGETRLRDAELAAEGDAAEVRPHLKPRSPIDAVRFDRASGPRSRLLQGAGRGRVRLRAGLTSTIP